MTNYGITPTDSSSPPLPLGCVYVPNVGLVPLQGYLVFNDSVPNASALAAMAAMGIYNAAAPTPASGTSLPLQLDSAGNLLVSLTALGHITDAAVIDPTLQGTVIAFLKGMQTELVDIEANTASFGGQYNTVPPTLTNGQTGTLQTDQYGNLSTTEGTYISGEDPVRN